jgi:hypothetical protein
MKPHPFSNDPNYRAVIRGFLQLHKLDLAGQNTSPEADIVRDALDAPWRELSEVERERMNGLSEDLYSLSGTSSGDSPKTGGADAQRQIVEVFEAKDLGEWDRALTLLRAVKEFVAPDVLSFVRARIWFDAGDREVAVVFLEHATSLAPDRWKQQGGLPLHAG